MRERISQVQRCRQLKLAEHDTHEKTKSLPRPVVNHQHRATKHAVGSYSKTPIEDTILSIDRAPVRVLEEDEARSDEFESFLNHYWNDELERSNPDQESWLFSNPHQFGSLNPIMSTSSPQVSMTDHASLQYSDTTSNIDSSITGGPLESESLPASGSSSSGTYTGVDALMTDFRPTVSLLNLPGLENELGGLQNGELAVSDTNPSLKSRADRSSDIRNDAQMMRSRLRSQEPNRIYAACIPLETQARSLDHIQDLRAPRASSTADLSHLLDRLSISSMGDRRLIEDLLDNSSGPSSSTRSSSRFSIGSSGRFQETHLMARIRSGASEDKDIEELIRADTDINAQNTRGETALHLSVKLGKMSATTALLNRGANVHLKNTMGEGVLAVAQNAQRRAKEDESLYARIAACMAMAMAAGAVAAPVTTPPLIQEHPRLHQLPRKPKKEILFSAPSTTTQDIGHSLFEALNLS